MIYPIAVRGRREGDRRRPPGRGVTKSFKQLIKYMKNAQKLLEIELKLKKIIKKILQKILKVKIIQEIYQK